MSASPPILHVFNRYLQTGGEELAVEKIHKQLVESYDITRCFFSSADWSGPSAPNAISQAMRFFYNPESAHSFEESLSQTEAKVALFHNIYPVGSPSLYRTALRQRIPVIQYLHNFRPFSVGASLYYNGRVETAPLRGDYLGEVVAGVWQGRLKSALCAMMLKSLHRSGWLESVKAWVAISNFMAEQLTSAGVIRRDRMHVLRHAWEAMPEKPSHEDAGHYLFLGRLIPEKGIEPMLQSWHELKRHLGNRTPPLHVAGSGVLERQVRNAAACNDSIHYLGQISGLQKSEELRTCRALVAPSVWWEPLGLITYEAYDYGKPVLAARAGGLTETVQQGKTGLLHTPGKVSALVADVLTMGKMSSEERQQMGECGRDWLLREASLQKWLKGFDEILQAALQS
jgi:glycosyltransferase involved in cell wall biosynthesis